MQHFIMECCIFRCAYYFGWFAGNFRGNIKKVGNYLRTSIVKADLDRYLLADPLCENYFYVVSAVEKPCFLWKYSVAFLQEMTHFIIKGCITDKFLQKAGKLG